MSRAITFLHLALGYHRHEPVSPELRAFFQGWMGPTLPNASSLATLAYNVEYQGVDKLDNYDRNERDNLLAFSRRLEEVAHQIKTAMKGE